jgi:hypothetical protein
MEEDIQIPFQAVWRHYAASFPAKVKEADDMAASTLREAIEKGLVQGPAGASGASAAPAPAASVLSPVGAAHIGMAASPASAMNATVVATPRSPQQSTPDENLGYLSGGPASAGNVAGGARAGAASSSAAAAACQDTSGRQLTFSGVHVNAAHSVDGSTTGGGAPCGGLAALDGAGGQLLNSQVMR